MIKRLIAVVVLSVALFGCASTEIRVSSDAKAELRLMYEKDEPVAGATIIGISSTDQDEPFSVTLLSASPEQLAEARRRWPGVEFDSSEGFQTSKTLP
jgi:hypothetical protein